MTLLEALDAAVKELDIKLTEGRCKRCRTSYSSRHHRVVCADPRPEPGCCAVCSRSEADHAGLIHEFVQ